jgi:hypothetical protein
VRLALLVTLLGAGTVAAAAPASAQDNGAGGVGCQSTEICFRNNDYGSNNMRKQFWYGANHGANSAHGYYLWWYVPGSYRSNERVMDSADSMRNRDTACTVWVWNVDGSGNWYTYRSQGRNASSWTGVSRINNGHSRCGGGSGYNPRNL